MAIDDLVKPNGEPDTVVQSPDDPRLDYAWKWFNFHAEQRTKMFNYMLVGLGILATAIATMIQKGLAPGAMVLSGAGVALCIAFLFMDLRNRNLYNLAQQVLLELETTQLFPGDGQSGIVKELERRRLLPRAKVAGFLGGQHRYWMPIVTVIFIILFALAFCFALHMPTVGGDTIPDKAVLICCTSEAAPTPTGSGAVDPAKPSTSLVETARFAGFAEGDDKFDCSNPSNVVLINKVHSAIQRAETQRLHAILFLVGGTDRAALSPVLRARFESNAGLARARITAVEQCLNTSTESARAPHLEVIRLVTGHSYAPRLRESQAAAAMGQARDREVQALIIGMSATESSYGEGPK